mmetsp:Transcript_14804/g.33997  ORF Transcript_14804/g.33997 Transcript_14804/m.33997 type:complete len:348 (+) Transcript_14804:196-1239(+)
MIGDTSRSFARLPLCARVSLQLSLLVSDLSLLLPGEDQPAALLDDPENLLGLAVPDEIVQQDLHEQLTWRELDLLRGFAAGFRSSLLLDLELLGQHFLDIGLGQVLVGIADEISEEIGNVEVLSALGQDKHELLDLVRVNRLGCLLQELAEQSEVEELLLKLDNLGSRVLGKLLDIFLLGVAREIPALEPTTVSGAVLCLASAAKHVLRVLKVALLDFALQGDLSLALCQLFSTTLLLLLLLLDQPLGSLSLLGALLWKLLGQDVVDLTQPLKEFCLFFPQLGQLLIRILLFLLFLVRPFIFIRLLLNLNVVLVSIFPIFKITHLVKSRSCARYCFCALSLVCCKPS